VRHVCELPYPVKLEFHDADTDTDILARDTRDFLKLFLWQAERHADILATIIVRMSARKSVSAPWNASFSLLHSTATRERSKTRPAAGRVQGDGAISFIHVVSGWSECSVSCGQRAGGVQTRSVVACTLLGDGWTLDVNQSYCDDVDTPTGSIITQRDCDHDHDCPRWTTDEWRQVRCS